MPALHELQRRFFAAIAHDADAVIAPYLSAESRERIDVYRNNLWRGREQTLLTTFPATARLVGAACFTALARRYARHHPSRSGDLNYYGAGFPRLLSTCYAGTQHDYLVDVARLEWAWQVSHMVGEIESLGVRALARYASDDWARLRLTLQPMLQTLSSPYPILSIWNANCDGAEMAADIDLEAGGDALAIYRRAGQSVVRVLSPGEFALLSALGRGTTLGDAVAAALGAEAGFDTGATLAWLFDAGLPIACEPATEAVNDNFPVSSE